MIRVLVTGSCRWTDYREIKRVLDRLLDQFGAVTVVQGGAAGADRLAEHWAERRKAQGRNAEWETWPAKWPLCEGPRCTPGHRKQDRHGRWYCPTAGHQRNALMVESTPDLVVAFRMPGVSNGTDQCLSLARAAGYVPAVYEPTNLEASA